MASHRSPGVVARALRLRRSVVREAVVVPAQRGPHPVGITGAPTRIPHSVIEDSVAAHRHSGRYLALSGARVLLAASSARPGRDRCPA